MSPQQYLNEIERRFSGGDGRGAYEIWLTRTGERLDLDLSVEEQRRLRGLLHILTQMAAGLGWDTSESSEVLTGGRSG